MQYWGRTRAWAGIGRILYFLLWISLIFLEVWSEYSVGEILLR
jgi:hypothetical protein